MSIMIKLRIPAHLATLENVQSLPGLQDLTLDPKFGVVGISPKENLYVVRTDQISDLESRRQQSPEIIEVYGDIRISST